MKVYKDYRRLEDIDELRVYDIDEKGLYNPTPLEFIVDDVPFPQLISNIPMDVNILIPHNDGNDFIIKSVGDFILEKENLQLDDVRGRLLSKISPFFFMNSFMNISMRYMKLKKPKSFMFSIMERLNYQRLPL